MSSLSIQVCPPESKTRGKRIAGLSSCLLVLLVLAVALTGCGGNAAGSTKRAKSLTTIHISMGFQPNVQFAPFYVALKKGYYAHRGLRVSFNYQTEPNALALLSNRKVDFVDSGGDEVMKAKASGLDVRYVMTQYSRFPSAVFFLKASHIHTVSQLRGKTIGVPGEYGASYYGLLALLGANHVPAQSVHIQTIGYTQVTAVGEGKVDAAMGYAPNEPVELRSQGKRVGEFDVYKWANIAGAGLATSGWMIRHKPTVVGRFVNATLQAQRYTLAHPRKAFSISAASIHGLTDLPLQRKVLNRALVFWKPGSARLGAMSPAVWRKTEQILLRYKQIRHAIDPTKSYTNRFVR